jgi:hypothetical protein
MLRLTLVVFSFYRTSIWAQKVVDEADAPEKSIQRKLGGTIMMERVRGDVIASC